MVEVDEINIEPPYIKTLPVATSAFVLWWCWVCLVLAVTVMVLYIISRCSGAGAFLFSADCTLILPHPPCLVFFFLQWGGIIPWSLRLLLLSLLPPECSFEYLILALCHNVERLNDFSYDWLHFSRLGWRHYLLFPRRQEEEQVRIRTIWSVKLFLRMTFSGDSASLNMKVIRLQVSPRGIAFSDIERVIIYSH